MRKENPRTDIASRQKYPKGLLFRIVNINGTLLLDKDNNLKGRGIYLKKDLASIEIAERKRLLEKKGNVPSSFYQELKENL